MQFWSIANITWKSGYFILWYQYPSWSGKYQSIFTQRWVSLVLSHHGKTGWSIKIFNVNTLPSFRFDVFTVKFFSCRCAYADGVFHNLIKVHFLEFIHYSAAFRLMLPAIIILEQNGASSLTRPSAITLACKYSISQQWFYLVSWNKLAINVPSNGTILHCSLHRMQAVLKHIHPLQCVIWVSPYLILFFNHLH